MNFLQGIKVFFGLDSPKLVEPCDVCNNQTEKKDVKEKIASNEPLVTSNDNNSPKFEKSLENIQKQDSNEKPQRIYAYMHSECPLNRRELGRASWGYLHTLGKFNFLFG